MILAIGHTSADNKTPYDERYSDDCIFTMVLASFRFKDTTRIMGVNFKKGAACGRCAPTNNNAKSIYRAFPISGFVSNGAWFDVNVDTRARYRPCRGVDIKFLFAHMKHLWGSGGHVYPPETYGFALRAFRDFSKNRFPEIETRDPRAQWRV